MGKDHRHSASRRIAIYLYASFLARQLDDYGDVRCAYCDGILTYDNRALDHYDNDPDNTTAGNVVACCQACNKAAGRHTKRAHEILDFHLEELGIDGGVAADRVARILATPLPERHAQETEYIAHAWFGDRLEYERHGAAIRAARKGGKPAGPRSHIARERKRRAPVDLDDVIPF